MKNLKLKYYMVKFKTPIIFVVVLGGIFIISNLFFSKEEVVAAIDDSNGSGNLELYSALVGTIVGGAISLVSSIWVSNRQIKIGAELKRKEDIYKPLYNEMLVLKQVMFDPDKYFKRIYIDSQLNVLAPNYLEWNKIKNSTYYIEIDDILKDRMGGLVKTVNEYNDLYSQSKYELEIILRKALESVNCKIAHRDLLLQKTFNGDRFDYFEDHIVVDIDKSNFDWYEDKNNEIYEVLSSNTKLSSTKEKYMYLKKEHEEIISLLAIIIETIHIKYER